MSRIQTPISSSTMESMHPDPASCQMARRVQSSYAELMTEVDFVPVSKSQRAGLSAYYNSNNWAFLHITHSETLGRCLKLSWCDHGRFQEMPLILQLPDQGPVHLGVRFAYGYLQFYVSMDGLTWRTFGEPLRDSVLAAATGTFVMLCAQDQGEKSRLARFNLRSDQEYRAPENLRGAQLFMLNPFPFVRNRVHHTAILLNR
ncbi:hypothetical protein [Deinococcus cellulosilyticus]|uniref:Beta-xylosidase C-terminal Concanavalin A-like domain-containing protein n=1 Tax=Deinococcus cellulosilyticus (strain DSM 18568 / NBRC 106333 / KACC 11606 / 5516J-15) TaxID=1223518 RepID=A0A511N2K9_DEIC1|nr:hypothetical protein [Deinococcus cellulosilyticus]GEM47073.1 hypothetical protein DC3_27080 [Deinococcus cellulosilyticus NBRC 106333 = KACC 11606]